MAERRETNTTAAHDFTAQYVQYRPAIIAYFRRRGFSLEEANDLAQDTFLRAFNGLAGFRRETTFKTWLLRIATNVWRNALRERGALKREAPLVPFDEEPGYALAEGSRTGAVEKDGPFDALWEQERRDLVRVALKELPPQMQRCMSLYVNGHLEYQEIAAMMNISIGAVKAQLHGARERLKAYLGKHL